jgi:hypothetical protein
MAVSAFDIALYLKFWENQLMLLYSTVFLFMEILSVTAKMKK